jgi:hypothetical protein
MPEPMDVECPLCGQKLAAAYEGGLVNILQAHLHDEHAPEMPRERVRENVVAQLKDFFSLAAPVIAGKPKRLTRQGQ